MNNFILQKKIEDIVREVYKSHAYSLDYLRTIVDSDDFIVNIGSSSFAFIISEQIDIPMTAKVTASSPDNFIVFSQKEFNVDNVCEYEKFCDKIRFKTENYGDNFIPYQLKFLLVTPYNNNAHE